MLCLRELKPNVPSKTLLAALFVLVMTVTLARPASAYLNRFDERFDREPRVFIENGVTYRLGSEMMLNKRLRLLEWTPTEGGHAFSLLESLNENGHPEWVIKEYDDAGRPTEFVKYFDKRSYKPHRALVSYEMTVYRPTEQANDYALVRVLIAPQYERGRLIGGILRTTADVSSEIAVQRLKVSYPNPNTMRIDFDATTSAAALTDLWHEYRLENGYLVVEVSSRAR